MTRLFDESGRAHAATVLQVVPARILQIKTRKTDGYPAVKVAYDPVPRRKINRPLAGVQEKAWKEETYFRYMKEFRTEEPESFSVGAWLTAEVLKPGDRVDATGTTRGRGFQGVVKRYGFGGAPDSHGVSIVHRTPQSIGCRWPQRVIPGKRMPGHMGNETQTIKNLTVLKVEGDKIYVRGSVPGAPGNFVFLRPARGWKERPK